MEKQNRCVFCECRLEPESDSQSCKTCALRHSFDIAASSTSEAKKDQVRGKPGSGLLEPQLRNRLSSAQHLLYAASSNGKNNFSWLTSEYERKQNSFEGILSLRCQMNPLKMKVVCFPFLFNFIFLKFTAQICEKHVLSTMPKHGIKRGKNALLINIWEALLTLKPVMVLRFLFSKFQFFISWWTQFYLFSVSVRKGK